MMKQNTYSQWFKTVDVKDLPNHVLKAWRQGWRNWTLVDMKQHERLYDGYMRSHTMEKKIYELRSKLTRKLTWKERFKGRIEDSK